MNKVLMKVLALVLVAFAVIGCKKTSAPIYNVDNAPVTTASGRPATLEQVQVAIIRAGSQLGWQMRVDRPGLIVGTLNVRNHQAVIKVPYSAKSYSINYESSQGLDEGGGQIHRNYNGWVQNLDRGIRSNLSAL